MAAPKWDGQRVVKVRVKTANSWWLGFCLQDELGGALIISEGFRALSSVMSGSSRPQPCWNMTVRMMLVLQEAFPCYNLLAG
jgi:hypothetical protein